MEINITRAKLTGDFEFRSPLTHIGFLFPPDTASPKAQIL